MSVYSSNSGQDSFCWKATLTLQRLQPSTTYGFEMLQVDSCFLVSHLFCVEEISSPPWESLMVVASMFQPVPWTSRRRSLPHGTVLWKTQWTNTPKRPPWVWYFYSFAWISTVHLHCHPYKSHGGQADQAGPFAVKLLETLALLPSLLHLYMTLTNLCSSARPRQKVPQFKKNPRMMRCNWCFIQFI